MTYSFVVPRGRAMAIATFFWEHSIAFRCQGAPSHVEFTIARQWQRMIDEYLEVIYE